MISQIAYKNLFIAAVAIQIAFFWSGFSHTIVTTMFFLSTFALVFSRDAKPENAEDLQIPEVHYYQKERMNTYGYAMIGLLMFVSFLFYLITVITPIRFGLVSLGLWLFMIWGAREVDKRLSEGLGREAISDYIYAQLRGKLDIQIIENTVSALWDAKAFREAKQVEAFIEKITEIPEDLKPTFVATYLDYMPLILDDSNSLVSDEIRELNEMKDKKNKSKNMALVKKVKGSFGKLDPGRKDKAKSGDEVKSKVKK